MATQLLCHSVAVANCRNTVTTDHVVQDIISLLERERQVFTNTCTYFLAETEGGKIKAQSQV